METPLSKNEIIVAIDRAFRELESQKYALDQSAIVAITDIKGNIIYANEQFCQISKYGLEELLGKNHRIINSGYHPREFFQNMWQTISGGKVWKGDIRNKAKDGSLYWVATTITPFLNENNVPTMFVSIRFDITRQKKLESVLELRLKERDNMLQSLAVKNKQLEDFCYIISHNLRSPLSNLMLMLEMMEDTESETERKELFQKFRTVTDYLQETFDELVAAIQFQNINQSDYENIDLPQTVDHLREILGAEIEKSEVSIETDFSAYKEILYPKKYIESILLNLINNSIKYKSPDRKSKIRIASYIENGYKGILVEDNGLGLNTDVYGEKLFRMRQTFHKHPNARGFGLFMIKNQIESLGGHIKALGKVEEGLKVYADLIKIY